MHSNCAYALPYGMMDLTDHFEHNRGSTALLSFESGQQRKVVFAHGDAALIRFNLNGVTHQLVARYDQQLLQHLPCFRYAGPRPDSTTMPAPGHPVDVLSLHRGQLLTLPTTLAAVIIGESGPVLALEQFDIPERDMLRNTVRCSTLGRVMVGDPGNPEPQIALPAQEISVHPHGFSIIIANRGWKLSDEITFRLELNPGSLSGCCFHLSPLLLQGQAVVRRLYPGLEEDKLRIGLVFQSPRRWQEQALRLWLHANLEQGWLVPAD